MPKIEKKKIENGTQKNVKKNATTKSIKASKSTEKKGTAKEVKEKVTKKAIEKKVTKNVVAKKNIEKKPTKKVAEKTTRKQNPKKETKKKAVVKKSNAKVANQKKAITRKKVSKTKKEYVSEYYDLPYRYNETVVKILAQTPKKLFVYWDVADKDNQTYINAFGQNFFEKTYPVLLVHNEELNYTFEIPINDFANSWYIDINDSKTKYVVQLGRKFRDVNDIKVSKQIAEEEKINLQNDFVYISDSNKLETPNDHMLFEKVGNQITYRNIKNGTEFAKDVKFIVSKLEKTYTNPNVKDMYKELYEDEFNTEEEFSISNPGSKDIPTSSFK